MRNSRTKSSPLSINALVFQAFLRVRSGRSADVVIADPVLNAKFIEACHSLGTSAALFELNHCLYYLRKTRALEDHPTTKRSRLRKQGEYSFAAEIAARHLERRESTSLDRIICDPGLVQEFDNLAEELAPGFSRFEYRFAALNLRKKRSLKPEIVARIIPAVAVKIFPVLSLNMEDIPRKQGVYVLFYKRAGALYVGEAIVLRNRVRQHVDHSDRKELARWLWEHGTDDLYVELHILTDGTTAMARRALERELIGSRRPKFNISGIDSKEE